RSRAQRAAIAQLSSVEALSAIVIRHENGNRLERYAWSCWMLRSSVAASLYTGTTTSTAGEAASKSAARRSLKPVTSDMAAGWGPELGPPWARGKKRGRTGGRTRLSQSAPKVECDGDPMTSRSRKFWWIGGGVVVVILLAVVVAPFVYIHFIAPDPA